MKKICLPPCFLETGGRRGEVTITLRLEDAVAVLHSYWREPESYQVVSRAFQLATQKILKEGFSLAKASAELKTHIGGVDDTTSPDYSGGIVSTEPLMAQSYTIIVGQPDQLPYFTEQELTNLHTLISQLIQELANT